MQVANLWYVESWQRSPFFFMSTGIVASGLCLMIYREGFLGMLKAVIALATLPVCDLFRLATIKGATYTTLHRSPRRGGSFLAWALVYLAGALSRFLSVPLGGRRHRARILSVTTPYIARHNARSSPR